MRTIKPNANSNIYVIRHEVTDGVKKQADADASTTKIYLLCDLAKRGILVSLMTNAMRTNNFDGVDDKIRELVTPFLYNEGKGKMIPISRIVRMRNKDRPPSKQLPPTKEETDGDDDSVADAAKSTLKERFQNLLASCGINKSEDADKQSETPTTEQYRECCWKLSERGSVGETALHICMLVATVVHLELARRLVRLFPKMVNDIYLGDEYFGEAALHQSVVNEDPKMVKFLVDHGANVHERSIGGFFCADDQKRERLDTLAHEPYILPTETNYSGHVYWGEYPLPFAACLGLEDCYRVLLAKGADPDRQDTNGNTVLHMCVILNKLEMFNLAFELGASISIKSAQQLTPLSLAAKLTHTEMFFYLLKLHRDVYWQFCNIATAAYPLSYIDSISVDNGEVNKTSALSVVAFGEELGHLDMMDSVLLDLLKKKWETFAKKLFFTQIKLFCLYFTVSFMSFVLRPAPQIPPADGGSVYPAVCPEHRVTTPPPMTTRAPYICWGESCNYTKGFVFDDQSWNGTSTNTTEVNMLDKCYLLRIDGTRNKLRLFFELLTLLGASMYILNAFKESRRIGLGMFLETWSKVPGRVMFMISCILIVGSVPFRFACHPRTDDHIVVMAMFLTPMHFLYFFRGFQSVGPFVIMIYKMIISDLLCFVLIYMIFVFGFAEAFFVIFRSHRGVGTNLYFSGVIDSIMTMFLMSFGEFGDVYAEFDQTYHPMLAKFLFIIYMILVSVLLVNMLIAMMGHTYEDIASRPNEWLRQWARIVLIVERGMTREDRLETQTYYSEMRDNKRVFVVQWETNEEDRSEIEELKELKTENRVNLAKRRKKTNEKN